MENMYSPIQIIQNSSKVLIIKIFAAANSPILFNVSLDSGIPVFIAHKSDFIEIL